jgi:hypothetical protein
MLFTLCPCCLNRIEIEESEAARLQQRLTAKCGECGEEFFFEQCEVTREPESQVIG